MIIRVLMLLLALMILINLFITACCYITGENLYQKYGKQITISVCVFAMLVGAIYTAIALLGFSA